MSTALFGPAAIARVPDPRRVDRYADLFEQNGVDGWVLTEIDDADEYVEIGIKREHAIIFVALVQAMRGR